MAELFDDEQLLPDEVEEVMQCRKDASKHQSDWRMEARGCYEFVAGDQWNDADKARLEEQNRPCVTFNRIGPIIDSVVGYEINNRREVKYYPRTVSGRSQDEVFSEAARWIRDRSDAEDEETEAFRDAVICGIGWIETSVRYDEDPEGQVMIERVSPLEMRWDPAARRGNLDDANWIIREKWLDMDEIRERWPETSEDLSPGGDDLSDDEWMDQHDATNAWKYSENSLGSWYDPKEAKALVIQYQWREREPYYLALDPDTGEELEFSVERYEKIKEYMEVPAVKRTRWRYYQRFVCSNTLLDDGPAPIDDGFSLRAITGKRDEEHGVWYGLVRSMQGPQKWANAFFSQAMHAMQANSKGGLIIEKSAVNDTSELEEKWADPSGIVVVEDGALTSGAIKEKSFGGYPPSLDKLMQFSIQSIRDVSGVNLELLGLVGHEQTGILEQERKKSALTILAPIINSVRRYRKIQGRDLLSFMRQYLSRQTIQRLTNKPVPDWFDQEATKFDIVVEDSPTSPNLKDEIWQGLQSILPAVIRAGVPIPPDLLRFSPLPTDVAQGWIDYIAKQSQQPNMDELKAQFERMQAELNKLQKENVQLKDKREATQMDIQAKQQIAAAEAMIKQQQMTMEAKQRELELMYKVRMSDADRAAKLMEIESRYNTEMARIEAQGRVQLATSENQLDVQREQAVINLQSEREKRAAEREDRRLDKEAQEQTALAPKVEKQDSKIEQVANDFDEYRAKMEANRKVILSFLKQRGGEVAEIAEQLEV